MAKHDGGAVVEVRGVRRVYDTGAARTEALRGVDLSAVPGEFVALMGASGSGKSTLLHLIAGLDRPDAGSVCVNGVDLASLDENARTLLRRRRIGLIFQSFNLIDTLSAEENVILPLTLDGVRPREARRRAAALLEQVGLSGRRRHRPDELSGGEQQRVAIARALAIEPALLLADEPTGNLDSAAAACVLALLRDLAGQRRRTMLLVTHDPAQGALADRRVLLRDGRVVAGPSPDESRPPVPPSVTVDYRPAGGDDWADACAVLSGCGEPPASCRRSAKTAGINPAARLAPPGGSA